MDKNQGHPEKDGFRMAWILFMVDINWGYTPTTANCLGFVQDALKKFKKSQNNSLIVIYHGTK